MILLKRIQFGIKYHPLAIVFVYAFILRVLVFFFYNHITIYPDSEDYIVLAQYISNLDLTNYTGQRTPGFSLLIALCGQHLNITVLIQTILGVINCLILFNFCRLRTKNASVSFWITMVTTSFLHVVFYEFAILTETLSFTILLLCFWFIEKYNLLYLKGKISYLITLSFLFGLLYLIRPMFIYFPIGFFLFFMVKNAKINFRKAVLKPFTILIIPFICFYSWNKLNETNIGYFTSSIYLGMNLSQTATSFFEKAPDNDKLIRDIFIKHRTYVETNLPKTEYPMTVWYAYDELLEKTQLSPPELSAELGRISKNLFINHPDLYLKQVFISWRDFWGGTSSLLWNANDFDNKIVKKGLVGLWNYIQKPILVIINLLFLMFSLFKLFVFFRGRFKHWDFDLFLILIILSGSLAQALVAYGTNSRFCFPFFALIVYFVMSNLFNLKQNHANRSSS